MVINSSILLKEDMQNISKISVIYGISQVNGLERRQILSIWS